jgi:hypothetical protein
MNVQHLKDQELKQKQIDERLSQIEDLLHSITKTNNSKDGRNTSQASVSTF